MAAMLAPPPYFGRKTKLGRLFRLCQRSRELTAIAVPEQVGHEIAIGRSLRKSSRGTPRWQLAGRYLACAIVGILAPPLDGLLQHLRIGALSLRHFVGDFHLGHEVLVRVFREDRVLEVGAVHRLLDG